MAEVQQKADDEMFCSSCGSIVKKAAMFCPNCGVKQKPAEEGELSLYGYHVKCLKNYVNFKGRAKRKEYWGFIIYMYIFAFILMFVDKLMFKVVGITWEEHNVLYSLYYLATTLPEIAVAVRRLHDIGKSGLWIIIYIISYIMASVYLSDSFLLDSLFGKLSDFMAIGAGTALATFLIVLGFVDSQAGESKKILREKESSWL